MSDMDRLEYFRGYLAKQGFHKVKKVDKGLRAGCRVRHNSHISNKDMSRGTGQIIEVWGRSDEFRFLVNLDDKSSPRFGVGCWDLAEVRGVQG